MVNSFAINARWPARTEEPRDPTDATFCDLRISVGNENVTSYFLANGATEDHLAIPAYYLAEWVAENWWALLWEPRKSEDTQNEDSDFWLRHSILATQHGFVLPNLSITPTGDKVSVYAAARKTEHADATFPRNIEALVERDLVKEELYKLVEGTVAKLVSGLGTPLQDAWLLIKETTSEAEMFCRLVGALGLCPYENNSSIERALDAASSVLSPKQLMDLCLTSTPSDLVIAASVAARAHISLQNEPEIDLSGFGSLKIPRDTFAAPAYRAGYQAARDLRKHFGVSEKDIDGANIVFDKLNMRQAIKSDSAIESSKSPVVGITQRSDGSGKVALIRTSRSSRRFSGARAAYLFWASSPEENRLITAAVTRDQQASRAFAAELLAPQAYIRAQSSAGKLKWDKLQEMAERANVATDVIKLQATNCGLQLTQ